MRAINAQLQAIAEQIGKLNSKAAANASEDGADRLEDDDVREKRHAIEQRLANINPASAPSVGYPDQAVVEADQATGHDFQLEQAMAEIAARQRMLDAEQGDFYDSAASLLAPDPTQDRLLDNGVPHGDYEPSSAETTLFGLRQALGDIGRQIESAASRRSINLLESAVRDLSGRMERERRYQGNPLALSNIERSLREMRAELAQFTPAERLAVFHDDVETLSRKIDALSQSDSAEVENGSLRHIERAIGSLQEIVSRAATGEALVALADDVRALNEKLEQVGKPAAITTESPATTASADVVSMLNARFDELTAYLNDRVSPARPAGSPNLTQTVETLAARLDGVDIGEQHAPMLQAIATQLNRVVERLDASEARLDNVAQFETALAGVLENVRTLCAGTVSAAEQAVQKAALGITDGGGRDRASTGLLHDFEAIRREQAASDRRTQDALESVHRTLEQLVTRLGALESEISQDGGPAPTGIAVAPHSFGAPRSGSSLDARQFSRGPESGSGHALESRAIDPTLPADHPLEPGRPPNPSALTAAERIAASEAALGSALPVAEAEAKSNFIAAARRAAQAAASMNLQAEPSAGEPSARSAIGTFAKRLTGRRPLMLACMCVLSTGVLASLVHRFGNSRLGGKDSVVAQSTQAPQGRPLIVATAVVAPTPDGPAASSASPQSRASAPPARVATDARPQASESAGFGSRPARDSDNTPSLGPLSIASMTLPSVDLTGSVPRAIAAPRKPEQPATTPAELPPAFGPRLRQAALTGDASAAYEVGLRYAEGRGLAVNLEEAARWFERAATSGLTPAQYRLANLNEKGQGLKKNMAEAQRLYKIAAAKGHAKAMHNLAVIHAEGLDGKPDFKGAAEWFRQAATRGVTDSQYNLGILYARGLGVEQSLQDSYTWFALAAAGGDRDAGGKRDDIAKRLSADELQRAKGAVETFKAQPQPEDAISVKAPPGGWDAPVALVPSKPTPTPSRPTASRKTGTT